MKSKSSLLVLAMLATASLAWGKSDMQQVMRPSQTRAQILAEAIAKAEGYYQSGTIPSRYRNPGDLKTEPGQQYLGQVGVGKGRHAVFSSDAAGWSALRHQIDKIITRQSHIYTPEMTIKQVARKYAGNWRVWSTNVAHNLGVDTNTTLAEYFDLPPAIAITPDPHALDAVLK